LAADDHLTSGTHFLRDRRRRDRRDRLQDSFSEWREPQQRRHPWHLNAGGGAVHSINTGSDLLITSLARAGSGRRY
jgi:hypothetical protein